MENSNDLQDSHRLALLHYLNIPQVNFVVVKTKEIVGNFRIENRIVANEWDFSTVLQK